MNADVEQEGYDAFLAMWMADPSHPQPMTEFFKRCPYAPMTEERRAFANGWKRARTDAGQ